MAKKKQNNLNGHFIEYLLNRGAFDLVYEYVFSGPHDDIPNHFSQHLDKTAEFKRLILNGTTVHEAASITGLKVIDADF